MSSRNIICDEKQDSNYHGGHKRPSPGPFFKGGEINAKTPHDLSIGGVFEINLEIPTFALVGTIIGPESLTAVFGMGTGVSFPVWSPEKVSAAVRRTGT